MRGEVGTMRAELKAELRGELNRVIIGVAGLQLVGLGAVAAIMRLAGG